MRGLTNNALAGRQQLINRRHKSMSARPNVAP